MGAQILSFLLCGIVLIFLLARGERFRDALGFIVVLLVASIPIAIEIVRCWPTRWFQGFQWVLGLELVVLLVASNRIITEDSVWACDALNIKLIADISKAGIIIILLCSAETAIRQMRCGIW